VTSTPARAGAILALQRRQADAAQRAGRRGSRVDLALLLAALSLSLAALAATTVGGRTVVVQRAAAAMLILSLIAALSLVRA
jgi:hypothetical protein